MRRTSLLGSIAIAVALTGCASLESSGSEDFETGARRVFAEQAGAWNAGSIDGFMETYWRSEELRFASGGEFTNGWEATRARYKRSYADRAAMGTLAFELHALERLGPGAGMVFGSWRLERSGEVLEGLFTVLMRRCEGRWVIVHDHTSSAD